MTRTPPTIRCSPAVLLAIALVAGTSRLASQGGSPPGRWRTAWATSQHALGMTATSNTTARLIARVSIGGNAVRIRIDNTYGTSPLRIGAAYVGLRTRAANVATGSNRAVRFAGEASATVPPGGSVRSDAVELAVLPLQDLAVSLYLPDASVQHSHHVGALTTSYLAAPQAGDLAAGETGVPFTTPITTMPWLKSIDVLSSSAAGAIVAFGDSITDGTCATLDAHDRWVDWLAARLLIEDDRRGRRNRQKAVVNEGIGGNTVTRDRLDPPPESTPGIERLERDVLSHDGVSDVIVFMGTNDIRRGASAAQVTAGLTTIIERVKARGLRVFAATIIPRHNVAPTTGNSGWNDEKTAIRREVNHWLRTRAALDGILDFDAIVREPTNADLIAPAFNCDGIHPAPRGYSEMGRAIRLELFLR